MNAITELSKTRKGLRFCPACELTVHGSCHRFMHVDRRHRTPRSETKDFIIHFTQATWASFLCCFLLSSESLGVM